MRSILLCSVIFICGMATHAYAGTVELTTYYPAPSGDYVNINSTGASNFATAGGNVGIGTTNPQATLEVISGDFGGVRPGVQILGNGSGGVINAVNQGGGVTRNLILQDLGGRVGINMSAPTQMLDVNGNIAGANTTQGWVLGGPQFPALPDQYLRLTKVDVPGAWHNFACGNVMINGTDHASDLAEMTPVKEEDALELGDVVVVDRETGLRVTRSLKPYDTAVYGIVSDMKQAALVIAGDMDSKEEDKGRLPVALVGRVTAKVSAENGAIAVGDRLTTSSTPGHLMKCDDKAKCMGAVAGKALEPFEGGQGAIKVLVTLQ